MEKSQFLRYTVFKIKIQFFTVMFDITWISRAIIKNKFVNYHTLEKIMTVLDIISQLFFFFFFCLCFFWWLLIAFSWILRFTRDSRTNWLWHCNLAFSCVASLRTNFLKISLPHALSNALSVEELKRLGFNDGSGGVCFVY